MRKAGEGSPFKPEAERPLLGRLVPVTESLGTYRPHTASRDLVAALTVAALAVPSAMAYAEVAGVSPVNGLYALLLPTVAYALLGSSRQLVVGPEGSISTLVGAVVIGMAVAGGAHAVAVAAVLALLVAGCMLVARIARLGWVADYLSRPVLIGYIHGVAGVLVISQLGKMLGLTITADDPLPQLVEVVRNLGDVSTATLAVSLATLALLLPARFLAPRFPAALVAVAGGIALSSWLGLSGHGVAVVGTIPSGLPDVGLPRLGVGDVLTLVPAALGIFLVTFADGILTARAFAGRHGQQVDVAQELVALSAANAAAGLSQGFPVGASNSRTAVSDAMGVRTQVGGLFAAGVILLVLLFLTGPIADLPKAVLGATIVSAAVGLIDRAAWRELWRTDRVEVTIAAVTTAGVLVSGVLEAISLAVALSIVDVVRRSARPHDAVLGWVPSLGRYGDVAVHRDAQTTPGVVVYRLDDRLFFANAGYVKARVGEALRGADGPTHALVFDAEGVAHIDIAGLDALREIAGTLAAQDIELAFARVKEPLRLRLRDAGFLAEVGEERFHPTVEAAVDACSPS